MLYKRTNTPRHFQYDWSGITRKDWKTIWSTVRLMARFDIYTTRYFKSGKYNLLLTKSELLARYRGDDFLSVPIQQSIADGKMINEILDEVLKEMP